MTYIDPRGKVLAHLDRLVGWQQGETPAPVTVEWDLSNRCYLGCQDCHFRHTHVKGPWASKPRLLPMAYETTGDLADRDLVLDGLTQLATAGVDAVVWSGGGEPTLHPSIAEIVRHACTQGLQQGLYTAGGLITRELADAFRALSWVVVSLDAADGETYAREKSVSPDLFAKATDGIRTLVRYGPPVVGVSFLLHRENYTRAWDMLALARSLGATYATFRPAIRVASDDPGHVDDDRRWIRAAPSLFDALARETDVEIHPARFQEYADWQGHGYASCQGIRLNTTITPDGRVWICPQRRGMTALGDLRREPFAAIWAKHPGHYAVDAGCRAMCRLHPVNQAMDALAQPRMHEAFV